MNRYGHGEILRKQGKRVKKNRHRGIALFLILMFMIPVSSVSFTGQGNPPSSGGLALVAYEAGAIPNIDGTLSPSEWSDAKPYVFQWNDSKRIAPENSPLIATLTMKHDERNLYILFTINDDDVEDDDALDIGIRVLREENSSDADSIVLPASGEGYEGGALRCGDGTYMYIRDIKGSVAAKYSNGFYVFEASLNMTRYFNRSGSDAEAYFQYTDASSEGCLYNVAVAFGSYNGEIFLSSEHYSGKENPYDVIQNAYGMGWEESNYLIYATGIAAIIIGVAVIVLWKKRK